jgi:hypothetical protein
MKQILVCVLFLGASRAFSQELVVNGGFETGDFSGWIATPASSGSSFYVDQYHLPNSGSYSSIFSATSFLDDRIKQTLATSAGQQYTVSLWIRDVVDPHNRLAVFWEGNYIIQQSPTNTNGQWVHLTQTVTATANGSILELGGYDIEGYISIDDISVKPVPEPTTLITISAGVIALLRRRRRNIALSSRLAK